MVKSKCECYYGCTGVLYWWCHRGDQLGSPVCGGLCLKQHQTVPRTAGAGLVRNSAQVGREGGRGWVMEGTTDFTSARSEVLSGNVYWNVGMLYMLH